MDAAVPLPKKRGRRVQQAEIECSNLVPQPERVTTQAASPRAPKYAAGQTGLGSTRRRSQVVIYTKRGDLGAIPMPRRLCDAVQYMSQRMGPHVDARFVALEAAGRRFPPRSTS